MKRLETIGAWLFGAVFVLLSVAVAVEVTLRKVLNVSLQGVDELGGYSLAIGAGLAFALALVGRSHIRIDLVHERLPRAARLLLNVVAVASLAATAIALPVLAWFALSDSIAMNSTAQTPWATPLRWPQSVWFVVLSVFALVAVGSLMRLLGLALGGQLDRVDREYGPRGAKDELQEELADIEARGAAAAGGLPIEGGRS
ncbi:MAG: TRAP transporter small permease [Burkholderiales bacterium]|nr:MAG: TRAP transporter small permease [Burkholderiales bacterium]